MKTSEVLFKAAELFDSVKWIKGQSTQRRAGMVVAACAIGAIETSLDLSDRFSTSAYDAINAMRAQLQKENAGELIGLSDWNDNIAKDKRQVQRKMRKVARLLAKEGQ